MIKTEYYLLITLLIEVKAQFRFLYGETCLWALFPSPITLSETRRIPQEQNPE